MHRQTQSRQSAAVQLLRPIRLLMLVNLALTTLGPANALSLSRAFHDVHQNVGDDSSGYSQERHLDSPDFNAQPAAQKNLDKSPPQIKLTPSGILNVPRGQRIELTCEIDSSPPPRIYWVMGDNPVREVKQLEQESVADVPYTVIAREVAKLVLDGVTPLDQGLIHCVGVSGEKIYISEPTVLNVVEGGKNASSSSSSGADERGNAPVITRHRPIMIAETGSTVVLPCEASGEPRPRVHWYNSEGHQLQDPRYAVQPNGDLVITNLHWPDMDDYKCVASSALGEAEANTFLYPAAKPSDQRKANAL